MEDLNTNKDASVSRLGVKGFLTPEQESYDRERFLESLLGVREKLSDLERECSESEVLRDTVTICCEGIYRQLHALERKCLADKGETKEAR